MKVKFCFPTYSLSEYKCDAFIPHYCLCAKRLHVLILLFETSAKLQHIEAMLILVCQMQD